MALDATPEDGLISSSQKTKPHVMSCLFISEALILDFNPVPVYSVIARDMEPRRIVGPRVNEFISPSPPRLPARTFRNKGKGVNIVNVPRRETVGAMKVLICIWAALRAATLETALLALCERVETQR